MSDEITWKQKIKDEIEKIKAMDAKKRWNYFQSYYLAKTAIAIALILMLISMAYEMKQAAREELLSGCFINADINMDGYQFLTDDYMQHCGKSKKDALTYLSLGNTMDFMNENPLDGDSYEMALIAQISAGDFDYMILDEPAFEHYREVDFYADLEQTLSEDQQKTYAERIVYQKDKDGTNEMAAAIELTGTEFAKAYDVAPEKVYLVFIDVNQDVENNRRLTDYILGK